VKRDGQRGGVRRVAIIPESDLYRLVMRSKLPAAEKFEEWVVEEVLPEIRKHGAYVKADDTMDDSEIMARGLLALSIVHPLILPLL
jgi:anti-repressor protein